MTSRLPTEKDLFFLSIALEEGRIAARLGEVPMGALLVIDDEIISRGHNMRESLNDPTAHAEIVVIRDASSRLGKWRLTGSTLYVTSEPCPMCAGAIVQSRIKRLVFGSYDKKGGGCGSIINIPEEERLNHRVEVIGGLLAEESRVLLQDFFKGLREQENGKAIFTGNYL